MPSAPQHSGNWWRNSSTRAVARGSSRAQRGETFNVPVMVCDAASTDILAGMQCQEVPA